MSKYDHLSLCSLQMTHFRTRDTNSEIKNLKTSKVKGWKKLFQANSNENRSRIAILISCERSFKPKMENNHTERIARDISREEISGED